jgi:hypothetical protein
MKNLTSLLFACLLFSFTSPAAESKSGSRPPGLGAIRFSGINTTVALGGTTPIGGDFTIELWLKPADLAGGRGVLGSRNPTDYSFDLKLGDGKRIDADIGSGSTWLSTPSTISFNYAADSWFHLAYVLTPTNYTVFANGEKLGSGNLSGGLPLLRDGNHRLFLGWSGFPNEYFKGDLSEIRIWNVARTGRQIANNFTRHVRSAPGLVAYYPCDEKGGTVLHDATGNGNDGILQNGPEWVSISGTAEPVTAGDLTVREVRYQARLSDEEARFLVDMEAEAAGKGESSIKLFEGDIAVLPTRLSDQLKIAREGKRYVLTAAHPGKYKFQLELVASIQRAEPWNQIAFSGPAATISSITAQASGAGMELQLLSGTLLESEKTNGVSRIKGFLSSDTAVSLRWQGKVAEVARKALLTVESTIAAQVTPAVVKYTSQFHYDIVQGNAAQLTLALPASQALTRLVGEQIRDWRTAADGDRQILTIDFIKPIEKSYELTLYSEQAVENAAATSSLNPPQPLEVERESGALTLTAEDTLTEIESLSGLRQVNASGTAFAAYRYNARPFTIALKLKRIEPVINVADRITTRLEETRQLVSHSLTLNVEKAGVYGIEAPVQEGFVVAEVRGEGVEDWMTSSGKLRVNFSSRVLGMRRVDVQLERALKTFPEQIAVAPMRISGAVKETAQIGATSAAGIRLKTGALSGLREIPVNQLASRSDELLAYNSDQTDWSLTLASERLSARVVADVFNLVTIGDGIVGGSAIIRYGLVNQGVQEFKVKLPAHCRNVEFTGPNIRRKERLVGTSSTSPTSSEPNQSGTRGARPSDTNDVVWLIGLQDKAWGGYTLVVTYDYQFDPKGASLAIGGIHTEDIERETGSLAITTAASLQLSPKNVSDTLHRADETELAAADRAMITRAVVLAYQYTDDKYDLTVDVKRYAEERVLEAVADRTQITSVLTEAGEMLTQASFMVKNNEKQFQRFQLPTNATLWGCYVNGQPAKPERDGDWVLVSLPREANRDQAFAVDIMYAQTNSALTAGWSKHLALTAPRTDVPNTYAEWQLFVPPALRLSDFGGSMSVPQGTTYELLDAWEKFIRFYIDVLREAGVAIVVIGALALLVIALVVSAARRGWSGILTVLGVVAILAVLSAMLLPALAKAKSKAQRISSVNNLKQIGLAVRVWSGDNGDRFPASFEEMKNELGTDKVTYDPETGQRYTYIGAGLSESEVTTDSVIAYSPIFNNHCNILLADGSVQQISAEQFYQLNQRGLIQRTSSGAVAVKQERAVIAQQMPQSASVAPATRGVAAPAFDRLQTRTWSASEENGAVAMNVPAAAPATAAGIRSIRIELPQTGTPFLFTKVLNIGNEPLSIQARVMKLHTFQTVQMLWQAAAFVIGLALWWWQWHTRRNTFLLTVALALIIGSVSSLLIQWRALHDALIVGFPAVAMAIIALLVWKYWPRSNDGSDDSEPEPPADSSAPPVIAAIALGFFLFANSAAAAEPNVSVLSANYIGTVNDRVAVMDVTLQISTAKANQNIPLFGPEIALQEFKVKSGDAKLVRDGSNISVQLGKAGNATIQLKMLAKVTGDVTKRQLGFAIPPALSSQVALTLEQSEADVDFPTAISFKRQFEKDKTRVEAVIGSGDRISLLWTPRVKRAAEVAATVFCQNNALVAFGGGVMNVRATMDFQVTQGELRQARVEIPKGQRLLRVEGQGIRTWEIKSEGSQVLVVDLIKGASPAWRLTMEAEKALDTLPASVSVEAPHALDVKRETGLIALRNAEELGLTVEAATDLQRVDAEEFAGNSAEKTDNVQSVFRFAKPEFALRVRAEAIRPQIEAIARNNVRLGSEQIGIAGMIDYTIKRAGTFALTIALPAEYRVDQVTGRNVSQWTERNDNGARVLEVTLKEKTIGAYSLRLDLVHSLKGLPQSLAVVGAHPVNTSKLTTFISVAAEAGVAIKTASLDGLTEIPAVSLPDYNAVASSGSVLAYKFISSEPKAAPDWKLSVSTERIESWVRAEVANTITIADTLVSGKALVRFDIANAPVKEFRLRVPAEFRNVEINGANIRSRSQNGDVRVIELQSKTRGIYQLIVTWDQPRTKTNVLSLAGISAEGVERETGLFAIIAKKPLQVSESEVSDLQRVDLSDFPDWAGRPDETTALAYRYVRPGYRLAVKTQRFNEAEVLQALVDDTRLTTVVADDGQTMTDMTLSVRSNGKQFLGVELPSGAKVWSAFVAGQPVRPSLENGKLLLPIQQSGADDGVISVNLTYVGTNSFPKKHGEIGFVSPKFDVPLKNARWELYLPPDYSYDDYKGTMSRETAPAKASQPASVNFSLMDYSQMERANKASQKEELRKDVVEVKRKLASGNVREATAVFNRAKGNYATDKEADEDVKQLEKQLQVAQGSNLINAQNEFYFRNNGALAGGDMPQQQVQPAARDYDNSAAEQQWTKLQQAQEMAAVKVQPLHVNLPIRGVRRAFTQVLQTELNKPMTIQLVAESSKAVSWPKRIGTGGVAFVILWGAVMVVSRMKRVAGRN